MRDKPIIFPFGKFKGWDIESIPSSYIKWVLETDWFDKQYKDLTKELDKELKYRDRFDKHI